MSSAVLRRNSNKQGLQNLLRLTTQWSIEDEEEAARERRRREREKQLQSQLEGDVTGTNLSDEAEIPPGEDKQHDFKPSRPLEVEEDEGFSDWSLKLEQRKQRGAAEGSPEDKSVCTSEWNRGKEAVTTSGDREGEGENMEEDYHVNEEDEDEMERKGGAEETLEIKDPKDYEAWNYREENLKLVDRENETNGSCMTSSWAQQEMMHEESNEDAFQKEVTSDYHVQSKSILRSPKHSHEDEDQERVDGMREAETKLEKIHLNQEQKQLENQSRSYEEEECYREQDEITDRTESYNRSIKKSNSIKKSEPALPISKIDDRLEQYTHAVESASKTTKLQRQPSMELPNAADAVASKKTLFETGEVAAQSGAKTSPCKDTEGINIGVSDLINQWAKASPEDSAKQPPSKPTDITPGDILSKRNLWEQKGSPQSSSGKNAASGKKFKFVLTGHGKYEKVYVEDTAH